MLYLKAKIEKPKRTTMKKYSVKCGKRDLVLTKSQIYVGIKPQSFNTDPHQIGVQKQVLQPVSYTHLTLPTICSV